MIVLCPFYLKGQFVNSGGGEYLIEHVECISPVQYLRIEKMLAENIKFLKAKGILNQSENIRRSVVTKLNWPLRQAAGYNLPSYYGVSNFVDRNNGFPNKLQDYNCGMRTYDLANGYNHGGMDIFLWPFGWNMKNNGQVEIISAADGILIGKDDGNVDTNCDFNNPNWNAVYIQHADGSVAWYGHAKKFSLTTKPIGSKIMTGEFLGLVASSGSSTGPHLHFELRSSNNQGNTVVDPNHGNCNSATSWWVMQKPYYESTVNALMTHSAGPVFNKCPNPDVINAKNEFQCGDAITFAAYYHDQLANQVSNFKVIRPNGTVIWSWNQSFNNVPNYNASYWTWNYILPSNAPSGNWKFEVLYQGVTTTHTFKVNGVPDAPFAMDQIICSNTRAKLFVTNCIGDKVTWWNSPVNGNLLYTGDTFTTPILSKTTNYYVQCQSGSCPSSIRSEVIVTVMDQLTPVIKGDQIICEGQSTLLSLDRSYLTYDWSNGDTLPSIQVSNSGVYSVTVSDGLSCFGSTTFNLTVHPLPQYLIVGDTFYCKDLQSEIGVSSTQDQYSWSTGDKKNTILISNADKYKLTVTNSFGCSKNELFNMTELDPMIINIGNNKFKAFPDNALYQWYINGQVILNQNTQELTIDTNGTFSVDVTLGKTTCRSTSIILSDIINTSPNENITINASYESISIISDHSIQAIDVISIDGKIMFRLNAMHTKLLSVNSSKWPSGLYLIKLSILNKNYLFKVMIK